MSRGRMYQAVAALISEANRAASEAPDRIAAVTDAVMAAIDADVDPYELLCALVRGTGAVINNFPETRRTPIAKLIVLWLAAICRIPRSP